MKIEFWLNEAGGAFAYANWPCVPTAGDLLSVQNTKTNEIWTGTATRIAWVGLEDNYVRVEVWMDIKSTAQIPHGDSHR